MNQNSQWSFLRQFDAGLEGDKTEPSLTTPETIDTGVQQASPAAGEQSTDKESRRERFRALMEGEYKDLFTAYFQETFNRRFKEQKGKLEELERYRAVAEAAARAYGTTDSVALIAAIGENTPETVREKANSAAEERLRAAVAEARAEAENAILSGIRARGLRPSENGTGFGGAILFDNAAKALSRAERAEMARRAAKGERIKI
jgi:hypothetical protein